MNNALKKFQKWAVAGKGMKEPPPETDTHNNLVHPERAPQALPEPVEQINFKAPVGTKDRLRMMAKADKVSMLTVFKRALDLYEEDLRRRQTMA
jgi:hypothetical protein